MSTPAPPVTGSRARGGDLFLAAIQALRPKQWTKNAIVLAPLVFAFGDRAQHLDPAGAALLDLDAVIVNPLNVAERLKLIEGRIDAAWARWVRPWTLAAWCFLTLGIALGSWWAYYILGWGGFWFWDPVENASLMPWLAGTALLHSAIVVEKRDALKSWTVLLAILAFSLSLLGTFLVRSGVLTSVHAFAQDPARGLFILGFLLLVTGGGLLLYAWQAPKLQPGGLYQPVSREGGLILNNLLLCTLALTVLLGTLYPLFLDLLTGNKVSVGPPFFNATFVPICGPLFAALCVGPFLGWKRAELWPALVRLRMAFAVAVIAAEAPACRSLSLPPMSSRPRDRARFASFQCRTSTKGSSS